MQDLAARLAALEAVVADQAARIAELEAAQPARPAEPDPAVSRRALFGGLAAAAVGAAAAGLSTSDAAAADGDPLLVGGFRTAKTRTSIVYDGGLGDGVLGYGFGVTDGALARFPFAAAVAGHAGDNFSAGVYGYASTNKVAVIGESTDGTGVYGATGNGFAGVYGRNFDKGGKGVYGFAADGTGVLGDGVEGVTGRSGLAGGIGVRAVGTGPAAALKVEGRVVSTLAGLATIAAGGRTVSVPVAGLSSTSMILATIQNKTASAVGVSSVILSPRSAPTRIVIGLTGPAPTGGVTVAWFAVDRPA